MKKAFLAAGLLLLSCNAYAYDNYADGYVIKGKTPVVTINAENLYGYNDFSVQNNENISSSAHFITSFNSNEAEKYLSEAFSSQYFDAQYEKLALLKRSELSLQTIPVTLTDLEKYTDNTALNSITINNLRYQNFNKDVEEIQPILRIDKIGKYKTITSTYFIKQLDIPHIINTTFISAQDRLYILSSTYNEVSVNDDKVISESKTFNKDLLAVKTVRQVDIEEDLIKRAWEDHKKFLKAFKAVPVDIKTASGNFGYYDKIADQHIALPTDWLYQSTSLNDQSVKGQVTVAMPVSMIYDLSHDEKTYNLACDLFEKLAFADSENNEILTTEQAQKAVLDNQSDIISLGSAVFRNINSLFVAASFETEDDEFKELTDNPLGTKLTVAALLEDGFNYLSTKKNNYFAVYGYRYDIDFTHTKGKIDIIADTNYFKNNDLETRLKFVCNDKNKGSLMLFLGKDTEKEDYHKISAVIDEWQF